MPATLRFYGDLTYFLSGTERSVSVEVSDSPSVKDRIEACGVPHPEVDLILVNGDPVGFGRRLRDGDRVGVYPQFRSLVTPRRLRPDPPLGLFVVDVNLGKLAKYLRLLGFDAKSDGALRDGDIARISSEEDRILLTKDRNLLKRSVVVNGYFVREIYPRQQITEVVLRFRLGSLIRPFARCMECNGTISPVAKADVEPRLLPLTRKHFNEFRICSGCERIFWRGSHFEHLEGLVREIRDAACP
jgi:uncharacterized protein